MLRTFSKRLGFMAVALIAGSLLHASLVHAVDLIPKFPKAGTHTTTNRSVWDKWYKVRHRYPLPKSDETVVQSSTTGTQGTVLPLGFAVIYRISSAPRAGTTAIVQGRILSKYNAVGGVHGRLGFPTADADIDEWNTIPNGQTFEGGRIKYNGQLQKYQVFYNQ